MLVGFSGVFSMLASVLKTKHGRPSRHHLSDRFHARLRERPILRLPVHRLAIHIQRLNANLERSFDGNEDTRKG